MNSVVSVFGCKEYNDVFPKRLVPFETNEWDFRCYETDQNIEEILSKDRPMFVVVFGDKKDFPKADKIANVIWLNKKDRLTKEHFTSPLSNNNPLISVYTTAYESGDKINRAYYSLAAQTMTDWEWVVIDDSVSTDTWKIIQSIAEKDFRVRPFRQNRHSGVIGELKGIACGLSRGRFLAELDHDDELTPWILDLVKKAFDGNRFDFVYTDFAECFEDGKPFSYTRDLSLRPPTTDWGFGYGSYRIEYHNGMEYHVVNAPNINAKTIRHIVAMPNHLRVWRKSFYQKIGGYNDKLFVADDYELMVRSWLESEMDFCRIPSLGYIQYRNTSGNTHKSRNKEIQRWVRLISEKYDKQIHEKLLKKGLSDWVWKDGENTFDRLLRVSNPPIEPTETKCLELS